MSVTQVSSGTPVAPSALQRETTWAQKGWVAMTTSGRASSSSSVSFSEKRPPKHRRAGAFSVSL